ncbi:hypothetical protein L0668_06550 [Paraglaciecola aquimarina]|uniref:Glycosyltransferase 2-like domain-containing protein n=1 Tax=Paraglaciecola algarum TaxID=3050085 RepID=A0ABS9D493_9ALTE|nr:hypothetical protein [Paraglaciecola sp. G1-23]MCF2947758.1 hypothetical protein [Paraglaciecola sp. G1-23]
MFLFLTTIRHPGNANNFDTILKLLKHTIESVLQQQTQFEFKLVIVCNEIPQIDILSDKVHFHVVDFPPPGKEKANEQTLYNMQLDKGTKLASGLIFAKQFSPTQVFIIDSDDWVNSHIVEYVMSNKQEHFWFADSGYLLNYSNKTYIRKYGLCRYCGTSFIYSYSILMQMLGLDKQLSNKLNQPDIIDAIAEFELLNILGNHRFQFGYFLKYDIRFKALPFKSICWILNTGENHSGKNGGDMGLPVTHELLNDFGVVDEYSPSAKQATIKDILGEQIARITSFLGWIRTNKKAYKV